MSGNRSGYYKCRHPDCIYKGRGGPGNLYAGCDYFSYTEKCRSTQKGGKRAESCQLYVPRAAGQAKPRINQNTGAPQWHTLALSLYKAGKMDIQIAAAVGVSPETISVWRRKRGLASNPRQYERYTTFDTVKAMELYKEGLYDTEISKIVGCSAQTIHNWRQDKGLPPNGSAHGPKYRLDWEHAMKLYEQGYSDRRIAQELGCNYKSVNKWRRKNNLPSKHRKERAADGDMQ